MTPPRIDHDANYVEHSESTTGINMDGVVVRLGIPPGIRQRKVWWYFGAPIPSPGGPYLGVLRFIRTHQTVLELPIRRVNGVTQGEGCSFAQGSATLGTTVTTPWPEDSIHVVDRVNSVQGVVRPFSLRIDADQVWWVTTRRGITDGAVAYRFLAILSDSP